MVSVQDVFVIPDGAQGALAELERRKFTAEEGVSRLKIAARLTPILKCLFKGSFNVVEWYDFLTMLTIWTYADDNPSLQRLRSSRQVFRVVSITRSIISSIVARSFDKSSIEEAHAEVRHSDPELRG